MVALQVNWPGGTFIAIHSAAGNSRDLLIVDNDITILNDGHETAEQGDIKLLPGAWATWLLRIGREKTIDCGRLLFGVGVSD